MDNVFRFSLAWKLRISQPSFKATYQCYLSVLSRLVNLRILWFYDTMICSVVLLWYQQVLCYKTIMWCSLILWYNTNSTWCNDIYDKVLWYTVLYDTWCNDTKYKSLTHDYDSLWSMSMKLYFFLFVKLSLSLWWWRINIHNNAASITTKLYNNSTMTYNSCVN